MNYKDNIIWIGCSDYAVLTLTGVGHANVESIVMRFLEDGDYLAYLVTDPQVEIPTHYELTERFNNWLRIYDDHELTKYFKADQINIYRSGSFRIIIQLVNS